MALVGPEPISFSPWRRLTSDLLAERRTEVPFPPDINDLGNRNFKPTVTEPSLPNVALVS